MKYATVNSPFAINSLDLWERHKLQLPKQCLLNFLLIFLLLPAFLPTNVSFHMKNRLHIGTVRRLVHNY